MVKIDNLNEWSSSFPTNDGDERRNFNWNAFFLTQVCLPVDFLQIAFEWKFEEEVLNNIYLSYIEDWCTRVKGQGRRKEERKASKGTRSYSWCTLINNDM